MIKKASIEHVKIVCEIVNKTISAIYPCYYPEEVVDFFLQHHHEKNIMRDIQAGNVYLLYDKGEYIATGTVDDSSVARVFVLPSFQNKGYGTQIMNFLEDKISTNYKEIFLDSSLPAFDIYIKRGYEPAEFHKEVVEHGRVLCYHVMKKKIRVKNDSDFDLNNRLFYSLSNTANGEVSEKTCFKYYQQGETIWAHYSGGDIVKGVLIGKFIEYNRIYFTYQHLNANGKIRIGESNNILEKLSDDKICMHESWQWLNGDMTSGHSIVIEK